MNRSSPVAVILCVLVLIASAALLKPEPARKPRQPQPVPTPPAVLTQLDEWGARYKLNQHDQVDWLWLKRLPLSDNDLQILHEMPHVKYLNLRGIHDKEGNSMTDAGLQPLASLKKLELLDLSANYHLTDACSQWLGQAVNLRKLNLSQTDITAASLPHLSNLHKLQVLSLGCGSSASLTEETLPYYQQMDLRVTSGFCVSRESLRLLPQLTSLERLAGGRLSPIADIRDTDLIHIRNIKKIEHLNVELTNGWSDTSQLHQLQNLPNLKHLVIGANSVPPGEIDREGILTLSKLPALRRVFPVNINDEVLEALSHCPQVTHLELTSAAGQMTPAGLRTLKRMKNLKALSFPREMISDELIATVSELESLEVLTLDGQNLFPGYYGSGPKEQERPFAVESLGELSKLQRLKCLSLRNWDLSDDALEYLSRIPSLEAVTIASDRPQYDLVPLSEPALLKLRHLQNLKYLNMNGTAVGREAAEELHKFVPECFIMDAWCCGCLAIGPGNGYFDWRNIADLDR